MPGDWRRAARARCSAAHGCQVAATGFNVQNLGTAKKPNNALLPDNMCILKGFPTNLATSTSRRSTIPFGMWFANDHTLYVADEGDGDTTYSAATNTYIDSTRRRSRRPAWRSGCSTRQPASGTSRTRCRPGSTSVSRTRCPVIRPASTRSGRPDCPWSPATDGLRALTGRVNRDGTATIWAVTSTVSGGGDQGADPDKLVAISDRLDGPRHPRAETVPDGPHGPVRPGAARRFVHAGTDRARARAAGRNPSEGDTNMCSCHPRLRSCTLTSIRSTPRSSSATIPGCAAGP